MIEGNLSGAVGAETERPSGDHFEAVVHALDRAERDQPAGLDPVEHQKSPPVDGLFGAALVAYTQMDGRPAFQAQGGVNDQGLFIDSNAVPKKEVSTAGNGKAPAAPQFGEYLEVLRTCRTVAEAMTKLRSMNLTGVLSRSKFVIADKSGAAVLFEGDDVTTKTGTALISTNYRESHPELGDFLKDVVDYALQDGNVLLEGDEGLKVKATQGQLGPAPRR